MASDNTPEKPAAQEDQERSGVYLGSNPDKDPVVQATARQVRRIGYPILFGFILWLTIPILYGVLNGVRIEQAWDPFSKRPMGVDDPGHDCRHWGLDLLSRQLGAEHEEVGQWSQVCADYEPELHGLLHKDEAQGSAGKTTR